MIPHPWWVLGQSNILWFQRRIWRAPAILSLPSPTSPGFVRTFYNFIHELIVFLRGHLNRGCNGYDMSRMFNDRRWWRGARNWLTCIEPHRIICRISSDFVHSCTQSSVCGLTRTRRFVRIKMIKQDTLRDKKPKGFFLKTKVSGRKMQVWYSWHSSFGTERKKRKVIFSILSEALSQVVIIIWNYVIIESVIQYRQW